MKIFFQDPLEKPVEVTHSLKLYPDQSQQQLSTKKPVVSERYDEVVFAEPTEFFAQILDKGPLNARKSGDEEMKEVTHEVNQGMAKRC